MRRFVFAPSWLAGHVLIVAVVVTCLLLGRWQWGVSQHTHSLQNMAYAIQWPIFAVFFAVMWLRMLRLECRKLDGEFDDESDDGANDGADDGAGEETEPSEARQPVPSGVTKTAARPEPKPAAEAAAEDEEEAQLAAYNRMLAELAILDKTR